MIRTFDSRRHVTLLHFRNANSDTFILTVSGELELHHPARLVDLPKEPPVGVPSALEQALYSGLLGCIYIDYEDVRSLWPDVAEGPDLIDLVPSRTSGDEVTNGTGEFELRRMS